jgi:hypothetical protein
LIAGMAATASGGCESNSPAYFPAQGPVAIEVGAAGGPTEATQTVTLPFRAPSESERQSVMTESQRLKFAVPWLRRAAVAVSIQYTITNLSDKQGTARILINGASEFASYDAAAIRRGILAMLMAANQNQNNQPTVLSLIEPKPVLMDPGQSLTGTIREDDFVEAALDLDAVGRWMAPPLAVLSNRSEVNPVGMDKVPAGLVVPAIWRVMVTFSASTHMRFDFVVRVRDTESQLYSGSGNMFAPTPRPVVIIYTPQGT